MKKRWLLEITWLALLAAVAFVGTKLLVASYSPFLMIQTSDTTLFLNYRQVFTSLFLNALFWGYLFRQIINRYTNQVCNIIMLVVTFLVIYNTFSIAHMISDVKQGWTIYPPCASVKFDTTVPSSDLIGYYEIVQIIILILSAVMITRKIRARN